jgi:hypothetical protein
MSIITVGKENTDDIDLYYEDHGSGQPGIGSAVNAAVWAAEQPRPTR